MSLDNNLKLVNKLQILALRKETDIKLSKALLAKT